MGVGEYECYIGAMTTGNGVAPGPAQAKVARVDMNSRKETKLLQ
jgi:hypothetical protein